MSTEDDRTLVPRTIEGTEALVSTDSGEIFIDVPASNPRYVRVEEGETVQEGDVRSRGEDELSSPALRKWRLDTIGPETVIGTDVETEERREWKREALEQQLAVGGLSTDLTDFERASVVRGGESDEVDREDRPPEDAAVTVVVYGNNGRRFTQTYRLADEGAGSEERRLELAETDNRVEEFGDDLRKRFARAVEFALRNEGYAV